MSLNAAMIQMMVDKGLSGQDIADIAKAGEAKVDRTAAERQARHREKSRRARNGVTLRRDPPIEDHTPSEDSPNGESHNGKRDVFPKPEWAEDEPWADFLENRRRKKRPNTASAYKKLMADIDRIADDEWPPGKLLDHAAGQGWAGIYDPREKRNDRKSADNNEICNPYARVAARQAAGAGFEGG